MDGIGRGSPNRIRLGLGLGDPLLGGLLGVGDRGLCFGLTALARFVGSFLGAPDYLFGRSHGVVDDPVGRRLGVRLALLDRLRRRGSTRLGLVVGSSLRQLGRGTRGIEDLRCFGRCLLADLVGFAFGLGNQLFDSQAALSVELGCGLVSLIDEPLALGACVGDKIAGCGVGPELSLVDAIEQFRRTAVGLREDRLGAGVRIENRFLGLSEGIREDRAGLGGGVGEDAIAGALSIVG